MLEEVQHLQRQIRILESSLQETGWSSVHTKFLTDLRVLVITLSGKPKRHAHIHAHPDFQAACARIEELSKEAQDWRDGLVSQWLTNKATGISLQRQPRPDGLEDVTLTAAGFTATFTATTTATERQHFTTVEIVPASRTGLTHLSVQVASGHVQGVLSKLSRILAALNGK